MNNFPKINECIDVEVLQEIQDRFAEATGLAAITVDYMGKPITKYSNFSRFCMLFRKNKECNGGCLRSDAHGGIEAARSGKPYIYKCHTGLIDFAIPIIIEDQYLGAILGGQVKLEDDEEVELDQITSKSSKAWKEDEELVKAYEEIKPIQNNKLQAAADMMFVITNYFVEKGLVNLIQEELNKKSLELMEEIKIRAELEKSLKVSEIKSLQAQMNPHFLFNVLNTIARLALLENAVTTEEIVFSFAELLRYTLKNNSTKLVNLQGEIQYIQNYLKIQAMRLGERLKYTIEVEDETKNTMVPFMMLQPIVENAINHGIEKKKEGGTIDLSIYKLNEKVIIKIKDNGVGMSEEKLCNVLNENKQDYGDSFSTGIGMNNLYKRLSYHFQGDYKFDINSEVNKGTSVKIQIPISKGTGDFNV